MITIEETRLKHAKSTAASKKAYYGQFLTPASIAWFMAGLFRNTSYATCRLLDPGAGIGSLSSAFLERCSKGPIRFKSIDVEAYELDDSLHEALHTSLSGFSHIPGYSYNVSGGDFIESAVNGIQFDNKRFTHAILNPPYKKINSDSRCRLLLRQVGLETVNLYSAFVGLTLEFMSPGGQVVAIIPRSFCNGPYYRPFREFLMQRAAIRQIHLFDSRKKAFKDDQVLQENVIVVLECEAKQGDVVISTSTDNSFSDLATNIFPFHRIVFRGDPEKFIHIPTTSKQNIVESSDGIRYSLADLGLKVSTGPIVDFRLKEFLRAMPESDTVPLLYPGHFRGFRAEWPKANLKKPNAIVRNAETEKWFYPNGHYCAVKRFSSKEEKRRIVASVVKPEVFSNTDVLGFENHLNVFHENKQGLSEALAHGLAVYLNTTAVDEYFRRFNGHTQVNATDLKLIKYPSRNSILALGKWAMDQKVEPSQEALDNQLVKVVS